MLPAALPDRANAVQVRFPAVAASVIYLLDPSTRSADMSQRPHHRSYVIHRFVVGSLLGVQGCGPTLRGGRMGGGYIPPRGPGVTVGALELHAPISRDQFRSAVSARLEPVASCVVRASPDGTWPRGRASGELQLEDGGHVVARTLRETQGEGLATAAACLADRLVGMRLYVPPTVGASTAVVELIIEPPPGSAEPPPATGGARMSSR
jgi:hypothetical protein